MDNYQETFSQVPPVYGKNQRKIAIVVFIIFQSILYLFGFLSFYAIVTLNMPLMLMLGLISIGQTFARRNQTFIDYINNILQVRRYSKGYKMIYQQQIDANERCLFGNHPHGVLATGILANMNLKKGPLSKAVGLSSRFMLACPIVGLFLRMWGVQSVDKSHMKQLMKQGKTISLMPGGFEQATLTTPKQLRIYIKNRKGFIKYAMENNYSIYPLLYLKEHQAFWTFDYFTSFRLFLNKLKIPAVLFWNFKTFLFLPPYMEYYAIVGKSIKYELIKDGQRPTQDQINETHSAYIEQLKRIYEKHKHLNGNVPMIIY